MDDNKMVPITVELTEPETWYFAQFLKRSHYDTFRRLSDPTIKEEPDYMVAAAIKLQGAFAKAGYAPR